MSRKGLFGAAFAQFMHGVYHMYLFKYVERRLLAADVINQPYMTAVKNAAPQNLPLKRSKRRFAAWEG